jgi:hypothetical protein
VPVAGAGTLDLEQNLTERTRSASQRAPRYLALPSCLFMAVLGAAGGAALRLAKPVDPPDSAFLARLDRWKALAAELDRAHHLQGPPPSR